MLENLQTKFKDFRADLAEAVKNGVADGIRETAEKHNVDAKELLRDLDNKIIMAVNKPGDFLTAKVIAFVDDIHERL